MFMTIDDATYYYDIRGEGSPILLLHGFTGTSATWSHVVRQLEDHFQLITIDLPGHGQTKTDTPRTMEECCADIVRLLSRLNIARVHLLGYSMGGRTALSFAMLYPEKVRTLILESASPGIESASERKQRIKNDNMLARKIEIEGLKAFINFWENIPLFETQKKLPQIVQDEIRRERLSQTEAGLSDSLRFMGTGTQPHWWNDLHRLHRPVQLIVGEVDEKFVIINKRMSQLFRFANVDIVPGAGHAVHLETLEMFTELVASFLKKQSTTEI